MSRISTLKGFIFAGEKSGDRQGAAICKELKSHLATLSISGVGGSELINEGLKPIADFKHFQVMGFKDVFLSLPRLLKEFRKIKKYILEHNPDFCLFIDSPDFSLRMETALRKGGYKGRIIQHVCPSIWAWKKKRKNTLENNVDLLTTILPFEPELFKNSPLPVKFVGHPLAEKVINYSEDTSNLPNSFLFSKEILSLFPGSRKGEILRNLPFQLKLATQFLKEHPNFILVVSCCRHELKQQIFEEALQNGLIEGEHFFIISEQDNYQVMKHSTLAIATSGTIALELGFFKIPTLISYKLGFVDYILAKHIFKISLPYYSLVNIIDHRMLFPENIGRNLDFNSAYHDLSNLFENRSDISARLGLILDKMHLEEEAASLIAQHIMELFP